ncbi:histone H3.2-like protein [Obelidium mucronatum]|nr:histone H3.2-like protein [Obelidium mucronatum]
MKEAIQKSKSCRGRFKSGAFALKEIKTYQRSTMLLLRRLPFQQLVGSLSCIKLIKQSFNFKNLRFQASALDCIQEITEEYMVRFMEYCNCSAAHAKRRTVQPVDLQNVLKLRR